jgi:Family of unknown function (DUF5906)
MHGKTKSDKIKDEAAKPLPEANLVSSNSIELPITDKQLTVGNAKTLLARLNDQFAVIKHGGKVVVLTFRREDKRLIAEFLRFNDFRNLLMHKQIVDGKSRVPVGDWWLKNPGRLQYDGLIFRPGDTRQVINNHFNLWRGCGVPPKQGDWSLMQRHIVEVMAAGDQERAEYILNWLAWLVQHPDQQAEVALIFRGKKGTGKGTLGIALMCIFGQHGYQISSAGQLIGKHNAHLRDCCFLFADEALWPGDRSAEGNLKRMITEPTLDIEAKYFDSKMVPNMLHVLMSSNEDWVVPASEWERRYMMCEMSDIHIQSEEWFRPLKAQLEDGGHAAMLFDLLHRDLGNWHPRNLPADTGLLKQQKLSLRPLDAWFVELLESGVLAGSDPDKPNCARSGKWQKEMDGGGDYPRYIQMSGLYDQAREIEPKLRHHTSDLKFADYLQDWKCVNGRVLRARGWSFPPLAKLRAEWKTRFPNWVWRNPDVTKWQPEEYDDAYDTKAARKAAVDAAPEELKVELKKLREKHEFVVQRALEAAKPKPIPTPRGGQARKEQQS